MVVYTMTKKQILRIISAVLFGLLVAAIIIGFVMILFSSLIINRVLARIKKVNLLLEDLSSGQADLTVQLPIKYNDEIDSLIVSVNKFLSKFRSIMVTIKSSKNDLEKMNK